MFSKIRKRFTYTNVTATLALVFMMTGGAYAANKYLITSTKQINPKVLKALKGNAGTKGAAGINGAQGTAGAQGPVGSEGKTGANGTNGTAGAAGKNGAQGATGAQGEKGATGATGPQGATGPTGSPWTPNSTLPKGATETGTWAVMMPTATPETVVYATVSFPIQVENGSITGHFLKALESTTECPGTREEPKATEGNLCVWPAAEPGTSHAEFITFVRPSQSGFPGIDPAGTMLAFEVASKATSVEAHGQWAVTAP